MFISWPIDQGVAEVGKRIKENCYPILAFIIGIEIINSLNQITI